MPLPPMRHTVTTKFAGVVAGIEVQVALVARQVVEAMRDQLAVACAGKIMIQHVNVCLRVGVAFACEVAD